MTEKTFRKYEIMFLFSPEVGEDGVKKELDELRKQVSSGEGKIINEDIIGSRELAYRIKKQDHAYYVVWNLEISTDKVSELEKTLNIHHAILRYLIVTTPENYKIQGLVEHDFKAEEESEKAKHAAEKAEKAKEKEKAAKDSKSKTVTKEHAKPAKVKKEEKIEEEEAPKAEKAETKEEEEAPKKKEKAKEESKSKLDELDEKLKSIINDPDISL